MPKDLSRSSTKTCFTRWKERDYFLEIFSRVVDKHMICYFTHSNPSCLPLPFQRQLQFACSFLSECEHVLYIMCVIVTLTTGRKTTYLYNYSILFTLYDHLTYLIALFWRCFFPATVSHNHSEVWKRRTVKPSL